MSSPEYKKQDLNTVLIPTGFSGRHAVAWAYYGGMTIEDKNQANSLAEAVYQHTRTLPQFWIARKDTREKAVKACARYLDVSDRKVLANKIRSVN